ncbi:MAG: SulP family inorganic anion transporter [Bacteroidia bacterium]
MANHNVNLPADGMEGFKKHLSSDAMSGFLVSLLALPLSLGIAKASDFPAIFGIVSAIIGGVIVSFFAGSRLTIKGPAAGLIVIASGAVTAFGGGDAGWHLALGAIVVAAVIQVLFGIFKLGKLADFFPSAAIHGMLAAIGVIIMSKQIHVLLGVPPAEVKGKEPLELLAMIPASILHENAHLTEIGITCLAILIVFSILKHEKIKKIPAPLVVLLVAIPMGVYLDIQHESAISNYALVKIGNIFEAFTNGKNFQTGSPFVSHGLINADFAGITTHLGDFAMYVVLFALIGSLESLLTAKAIDGMDEYKRKSDFNQDLIAVGIGNAVSGLLGGLAMISEVARSSANVANGAKTRWANFFHGIFLLLAVVMAVPLIEMIPNAALAAMLIFVGFRLAHPKEFIHVWHIGKEQFVVFTLTVIVTLATDLLIGIGVGILGELMMNLYNGIAPKHLFSAEIEVQEKGDTQVVTANSGLVFSNILGLKKILATLPQHKKVIIDLSQASIVDHTSMLLLNRFTHDYKAAGGNIKISGLENHIQLSHANTSTRLLKKA